MPSITFWTRLEPFTRLDDIDLGLQAQTSDPLWLLARQWQTGEFQGEDSGVPVKTRMRLERAPLARYFAGATGGQTSLPGVPYSADIPLEALVEREAVQIPTDPRRDLRLAAESGLYFLRLLDRSSVLPKTRQDWQTEASYRLQAPANDPAFGQDEHGYGYLSVMAGRAPDGFLLYAALNASLRPAQGGAPDLPALPAVVDAGERSKVIQAGQAYLTWFESRYSVSPLQAQTWNPERMEYAFAVSAAGSDAETALEVPEYPGGTLDWCTFNLNARLHLGITSADPQPEQLVRSVMPAPLQYRGMASNRWWEFEDGQVNFSRIEGDPDELMRLTLLQFALVYSNDWYVIPVDLNPGAIFNPKSLVVTDSFGERTLIQHYSALDPSPRDWRVFALTSTPGAVLTPSAARPTDPLFFLPPVMAGSLSGDPLEEVLFLRDELANLVWAVERQAPGLNGAAVNRYELYQLRKGQAGRGAEASPEDEASYLLATSTPDYWIPFLPVRILPDGPDIRLRRGMALLEDGDGTISTQPAFTRPWGRFLEPEQQNLSLFEEEVPRSGLRLVRQFQYARWLNGATILWLGRTKGNGRGEGSSGLRFDLVKE